MFGRGIHQGATGPTWCAGLCALLLAVVLCGLAAARADAYVYWINFDQSTAKNTIARAHNDGTGVDLSFITPGAFGLRGLTVDAEHIYWGDQGTDSIWRKKIDGSGVAEQIVTGVNVQDVETFAGHLYWAAGVDIGRANLDGSSPNHTFIHGPHLVSGVAVDAGHIYWTNNSVVPSTIGRANLDGSGVNQSLIDTAGAKPLAIAVNATHVFWSTEITADIGRANLDGTGVTQSFINPAATAIGVAIDAGAVYWNSIGTASIVRAPIDGSGTPDYQFITGATQPSSVAVDALQDAAPTATIDGPVFDSFLNRWRFLARVNPGGSPTTLKYEYGQTTAFGTVVPSTGSIDVGAESYEKATQSQFFPADLPAGTTYYLRACVNNEVTGPGVANQVCSPIEHFETAGTRAPEASTGAASTVTPGSAQVSGTVNAHASQTAYVFEYGTSTAFGQISAVDNAGSGTAPLPVSASLSGLQPNTTYFYRLVASSSQGTVNGAVKAFTTGPDIAPAVTTATASGLTSTSAVLNGTVDPQGRPTSFTFEYGTTTSFGQITKVDSAGDHNSAEQVSLPAYGLTVGTTYLYRIVATNASGTVTGPVMSFTTAAPKPIYWTTAGWTIARATELGTNVNTTFIPQGPDGPRAIAVDADHIYWVNPGANTIGRANLDGTGVNHSFITGADRPVGVAVDAGHIYWANQGPSNASTIGRANIDGTAANQSFMTNVLFPMEIAVDAGHIYWTYQGAGQGIARANLDGTGINLTFITDLDFPRGLAVNASHVFWADEGVSTIGRAKIDGSGVDEAWITGAGSPKDVAVDAGHVYWTAFGKIGRAFLDGSGLSHSFIPASGPTGIATTPPG